MPRISPTEFRALTLRAHTLMAGIPLHDAWAVTLPKSREGVTLEEFYRRDDLGTSRTPDEQLRGLPPVVRMLFRLRFRLGRMFRLDVEPTDAVRTSFAQRLTPEDRARSSAAPGIRDGFFRVVYRFRNEQLLEVQNRTVHAAALSALVEAPKQYRFYFAVYVEKTGWFTRVYMATIDPIRKWIVYPALLRSVRKRWMRVV